LKEIEEVLVQALPYVGYPAIATALAAAAEVIKEHGRRKLRLATAGLL
jgi:4-carboxymuconolactone decarboxylase